MDSSELRHEDRYDVQVSASMHSETGGDEPVRVTNLSNRGCRFTSTRKMPRGAAISIKAGRAKPLQASVQWRVDHTHGVRFDEPIADALLDHIRLFLSEQPALIADRQEGTVSG